MRNMLKEDPELAPTFSDHPNGRPRVSVDKFQGTIWYNGKAYAQIRVLHQAPSILAFHPDFAKATGVEPQDIKRKFRSRATAGNPETFIPLP